MIVRNALVLAVLLSALGAPRGAPGAEKPAPAAAKGPAAAKEAAGPVLVEKTVYVPYEDLQKVYEKEGRGIFLPYEEFLKLWTAAQPKPPDPPPDVPPAPAVVRGGTYTGSVSSSATGEVARLAASFEIEALKKGWSELSLPFKGVAVESVEISSPRAHFVSKEGTYALYLPEPGRYTLSLQLSAAVGQTPGKKRILLGIPPTAVSRLDLTIPEVEARIEVKPALAVTQTSSKPGSTRVLAFLGNSSEFSVSWMPPAGKVADAGALLSAEQSIRVHAGERILKVSTEIGYQILRGEADTLRIQKPGGTRLLSVKGDNIREWIEEGEMLVVRLHSPLRDAGRGAAPAGAPAGAGGAGGAGDAAAAVYKLALSFERILAETPPALSVPFPRADGVIRESGWAVLNYENGLRVSITNRGGLSQLDPGEVPEPLRADLGIGFRYLAHPLTLDLGIEKITPSVRAESVSIVTLGREEDVWTGWIEFTIAKAGLFRLEFRVPSRWNIASIGDPSTVEDHPTRDADGQRTVTVNLKAKAMGVFRLPFKLTAAGSAAEGEVTLAPPAILGVEGSRGLFGVSTPKAFDLTTVQRENTVSADVNELFRSGLLGQLGPDTAIPLAYSFRQEPASVRLRLVARKTEIDLLAQHLIEIADGGIKVTHLLDFEILYAGTDRLVISAPSSLDAILKIEAKEKKEVRKLTSEAGRTGWEILLQSSAPGVVSVMVTHELDLKGLEAGKPLAYAVPIIHGTGVRAEKGFIALRKEGTLEIVPQSTNLESIDAGDLPDKLRRGQIYSAFRYFAADPALNLSLTRYEHQQLATTVVNLLRMRSVLSEERKLKTQVVLFVQNTERQYLEVALPPKAEIFSISVAGRTQPPRRRKDGSGTLIQIPPSAGTGGTFPVVIAYDEPLAESHMGSLGSVSLGTPRVLENVPVSKVELELFMPPDYEFYNWGGSLRPSSPGMRTFWSRFKSLITDGTAPAAAAAAGGAQPPQPPQPPTAEAIGIELPTRGYIPQEFETLAPVGTLSFSYAGRTLFSFADFLAFAAALAAGIAVARKLAKSVCWIAAAFVALPLVGVWFTSGAAGEIFTSFLAAGIVLCVVLAVPSFTSRYRTWRAARLALAPDPFLEEAKKEPPAPKKEEPQPPKADAGGGKS